MKVVSDHTRVNKFADDFVAAHKQFIELVESMSDEQWKMTGKNFPDRLNDEDESRPLGVIALHVADGELFIMERIDHMRDGTPLRMVNFRESNAKQAIEHAAVTRGDVLKMLRANHESIPPRVRAIPDDALDVIHETPAGPATTALRLERVLIGHMKMHQGSIEAAISS